MIDTFYTLQAIRRPITGIGPEHLEAVIRHLRTYHQDTGGQLPSATGWLELVRHAVESTVKTNETSIRKD